MAPITSFIKITEYGVVPVRIFINRKEVLKTIKQSIIFQATVSSVQTKNHRALVRLRSTSAIYLSNAQVKALCTALKDQLIHLLLVATPESLRLSSTSKDKGAVSILIENQGWTVKLDTTVDYILGLRFGRIEDGPGLLVRRPKKIQQVTPETVVLQEEDEDEVVRIPDEGEELEPAPSDDKKMIQKYDYHSMMVLGKGIRLEVLKIPK